ncbi:MAG TPA: PilC/PilY family type IV pilus protein [Thermoanaerobaculia bacterium]
MTCHPKSSRRGAVALTLALLAVLAFAGVRPVLSDDIDLLRFNTSKPYVFFLLDTSASMTLSPQGEWVHANGDDPRSKLYQAKRILYEVFQEVDDVHFGFAYGNQDKSAIVNKHWLYYFTGSLPGGWPITYPRPDVDGPVQTQADGTAVSDVEGDLMTFGAHIDATGVAGTCAAPLALGTQREKINRYSKLGASGNGPTVIWLSDAGKTYRLTISRPGNKPDTSLNPKLGVDGMNVKLDLDQISNCVSLTVAKSNSANLDLKLWTDFVMFDENANSTTAPNGSKAGGIDYVAGFWDAKDVVDQASCGSGHPFSGKGWEGNYDGSSNAPVPAGTSIVSQDPYCLNPANAATCSNLKERTQFDPYGRSLDRGDVIPLDWRVENKQAFLDRLAPNQSSGTPDFRIASYFKDSPNATTGSLEPLNAGQVPLYGTGASPLGKMVIDFRCWFLGEGNKCNEAAYNPGWQDVAQRYDTEWGCRRPYLIVLSDGGDTCPGENPCADTANLNSRGAVRTWVIAYGANCASAGNPLKCMAQNGKGELLCPQTATDLKTELLKILGQIREEARAFASAAVPSVQAIVEDKIFLTNFTPLNSRSVWDGHVNSFLKPLPLGTDGKPDTTHPNHLWDAGVVMRTTQVNASDPLGSAADQRRVYYARDSADDLLADRRRLLDPTSSSTTPDVVRRDLWRAFEIPFITGDPFTQALAELRANSIIQKTLAVKSHTLTTVDPVTGKPVTKTIQYLLGDIFHSNPLVIGSPPNTTYFSSDVNGYRDFFRKHELRRKLLIVGSNDGMLHVFEAGKYNSSTEKFDNGTGKELFAYIPREVMPTVRRLAEGTVHQWGVDGTVSVSDVFIDPKHSGTPDKDDREWRTVIFGGLREGGASYYAVDITQPDRLSSVGGVDNVPQVVNGYVASCNGGDDGSVSETDCGPLPFPAVLWEFNDSVRNAANVQVRLDEDANGERDLGDTWSIPNVGRIRITEDGETVEKFVMVVGGGFDPDNKTSPLRGNWLYIIDVETGKALYKRQLTGAAPSEPAAVDTNQDGFLDRIYIGTTAGLMYRVDLVADSSNVYPSLVDQPVRGLDGVTYTVKRIPTSVWTPKAIFNANTENGAAMAAGQSRPIYYRPSVIFVTKLGKYALSFGTGDREDLWNNNATTGRFYIFVDDSDALPVGTVMDESRFQRITVTSGAATGEYLFDGGVGKRGWYLVLDPDERLITDPFALSGVSFFSTFKPDVEVTGGKDPLCSKTGLSRIFVVSTVNGNPFLSDVNNTLVRNLEVKNFVTNPFTEAGLTKNTASGGGSSGTPAEICDTPTLNKLKQTLQTLFPARCRFSNQTVDIKTISADTRLLCIAPVPVCTIEKNWREH